MKSSDYVSATMDYGVTSGASMSIPFEYSYASVSITNGKSNYAYITITGGEKAGSYSNIETIDNITGMTDISICSGTAYKAHHDCAAIVTFYFE